MSTTPELAPKPSNSNTAPSSAKAAPAKAVETKPNEAAKPEQSGAASKAPAASGEPTKGADSTAKAVPPKQAEPAKTSPVQASATGPKPVEPKSNAGSVDDVTKPKTAAAPGKTAQAKAADPSTQKRSVSKQAPDNVKAASAGASKDAGKSAPTKTPAPRQSVASELRGSTATKTLAQPEPAKAQAATTVKPAERVSASPAAKANAPAAARSSDRRGTSRTPSQFPRRSASGTILESARAAIETARSVSSGVSARNNGATAPIAEIQATVFAFMRSEGEHAVAHLTALSQVRSPTELVKLQVGEFQRVTDASVSCMSDVMRTLSKLSARAPGGN